MVEKQLDKVHKKTFNIEKDPDLFLKSLADLIDEGYTEGCSKTTVRKLERALQDTDTIIVKNLTKDSWESTMVDLLRVFDYREYDEPFENLDTFSEPLHGTRLA
jgi:hypothetical protein